MFVVDPSNRISMSNQIPSNSQRTTDNVRANPQYGTDDETPSILTNTDQMMGNPSNPQVYMNTDPQYDLNLTYHGYDLSRDVSEYRFGDDGNDSRSVVNRPVPTPRKNRPSHSSNIGALDNKTHREQWRGRFDFFFSSLGYAVGLGAIWRFPYLCYRNGGGVFLIPYIIFLFLLGIPLFFLEINLGQFTSQGPVQCWKMAPIFKGLGISMSTMSFFLSIYYAMLVAYSILYFVLSFRSKLEWATCGSWSSHSCVSDFTSFIIPCNYENTYKDANGRCYAWTSQGSTPIGWWDIKSRLAYNKPVLPSDEYFNNYILNKSPDMGFISTMQWPLVLSLLGTWVLVFICLCRGIKMSGKVVYFTASFPYVILLVLGIRGWTLPGMSRGIYFYMKPDLSRLADPRVWNDAANQIFFVLSVSYGGLITLSSYNRFNQPTLANTFVITIANVLTSILGGFVIFAYLGYLSYITGQDVDNVVSQGPGLAFVVYPFAVTTLPAAPLWSILFFLMLILLGIDTMFASVETIVVTITDQIHGLRRHHIFVTLIVCVSMFGLGLLLCTDAGIYWIAFLDQYTGFYPAFIIGFFECIVIAYIYGGKNFRSDIKMMLGKKNWSFRLFPAFQFCWMFITPGLLLALIIYTAIDNPQLRLGNYTFPRWSYNLGTGLMCLILSGIVFYAIYAFIKLVIIQRQPFSALFNPETSWGPLQEQDRKKMKSHDGGQQGALISTISRFRNKTLSQQALANSRSSDLGNNEKEVSVSGERRSTRSGSESAV